MSCHCRKRARKTGAWAQAPSPLPLALRGDMRDRNHGFWPQGGGEGARGWDAPLYLATRLAEQVEQVRKRRGDRGGGAAVSSWPALAAGGGGRSARRRDLVPPGSVGSRGTAGSTCCAGLGGARGARRPQPGLSPSLRPPEPRPLLQRSPFQPVPRSSPAAERWRGEGVAGPQPPLLPEA